MTMFIPTGGSVAVDPADCNLIAPRVVGSSTFSTLYLDNGQPVLVNATPAALKAEIDAQAGIAGGATLWVGPIAVSQWPTPIYFAGAKAKRVTATPGNLGSSVTFAGMSSLVVAPAITLAAMIVLINATVAAGSAGGGGGSVVPWVPAPVSSNASGLAAVFSSVTRIGNVVSLAFGLTGTGTLAGEVNVTVPLPLPCASPTAGIGQGDGDGSGTTDHIRFTAETGTLTLTFTGATATPFGVWGQIEYTTP